MVQDLRENIYIHFFAASHPHLIFCTFFKLWQSRMNLLQKDNILSLVPYLVFEIHANQMVSSLFNLCLAPKITKDMGKVDWNDHTCQQIARLWRTFSTTVSVHVHLALSNILVRDPYIFTYVYCVCVCMCVCVRAPVSIVFVFVRIFVTIFALSPNHFADSRWRLRLLFLAFVLCSLLAMILSLSSSLILIYSNIVGWFAHELGRQASETDHHGQLGAR